MHLPDRGQGLTPTESVGRGLILRTTLPAQWAVCQPHQMEVPTQGVVPGKKSSNHPGLSPSKGQKPNPGALTRPGDQLLSLSLGVPKIPPSSLVLVPQPAINPRPNILPRDPQSRLRTHETGGRAVHRKPVGSLIASHTCMPRDPIKSHCMWSRDILQHLLTLANQWRHSDSPESLQSRLTIRANTCFPGNP
jgi:hypothetical protein